ncbi:RagB/SusD family nutrient uptake outer membrane protein [Arenibacter sp. ARW7G5Y1]|uniref:RagB/SusD family nutrient uptake outer membrane protein n=1 Tax=Arenibacter sp. ARW7G5Y1 TaxID=2135619 RepID=UPI000D762136|nr:RagB/SusD family nutrient uptake outer membrane protein [Arenibacter sp. ARW7G5Y1]PXX28321.1 RagB/SusD domain-containing protein [Arenibacter sp. ARW7G5Y1]
MKFKNILSNIILSVLFLSVISCDKDFLGITPEDKITSSNFPQNEADIQLLLSGVYNELREGRNIWDQIMFGFGMLDGATPNSYNWGNTNVTKIGNGSLSSGDNGFLTFRWTKCYALIFKANYLLEAIEAVELNEDSKSSIIGEAHFLRGLAYSILAETYGGVPIIESTISTEESKKLSRASIQDTWDFVISDYDIAIDKLKVDAPEVGRATKGAALGMKMRSYLYQNKFEMVLKVIDEIDALNKYALFPSYDGLFKKENENNQEVLFDVQYISGENSQGSMHDQYSGIGTGSFTRGSRYVPTQDLIDAYEMIDGSDIDPDNPYTGRDPRMEITCVVPGAYFLGYRFPNYIYPGGAYNHPGCQLKQFSARKYQIEPESELPPPGQSDLNYIVMRYADVILSKAEAIIETDGNIDEAINLINRIRTERDDVKITSLPLGLSQEEAREKLRHERRIEFAFEGLYWSDIKRWNIGKDIYPYEVRNYDGGIIETKFPGGYLEYYNLLPIPDSEISLNNNLVQNPGW